MSGVTTSQRSARSSLPGIRTLPWLNIEVALSSTANRKTPSGGGPSAAMTANLIASEMAISSGWKRMPVVKSTSWSEWCTRCSRHSAGTAWNITCWR